MRKFLAMIMFGLLFVGSLPVSAQVRMLAEQMPQFEGGVSGLKSWIKQNMNYPQEAIANKVEGRVMVKLIITEDGSVSEPKIVRPVSDLLDAEALRLVSQMPKWQPAMQDGKPCSVEYMLPIEFKIADNATQNKEQATEAKKQNEENGQNLVATKPSGDASKFTVNGIAYLANSSESVSVASKFDNYKGVVSIPESVLYDGTTYRVTKIGDAAFYGCKELTSVNLPNSINAIGKNAFGGCKMLTSITIPNGVIEIGEQAFMHCYALKTVVFPNSLKTIGKFAFYQCTGLTSIVIPAGVKEISSAAFQNCINLTSVSLPQSMTTIGAYAFWNCKKLAKPEIPSGVNLGEFAFPQGLVDNSVYAASANAKSGSQSSSTQNNICGVYKVVDGHGKQVFFKLETTASGENTVRIKYIDKDGKTLAYDGLEYTPWGHWEVSSGGEVKIWEDKNRMRDLYISLTGRLGEAYSSLYFSKGWIYAGWGDFSAIKETKRKIEKLSDINQTTKEEIAKENQIRQQIIKANTPPKVSDETRKNAVGVYTVKDRLKTTYFKLDANKNVYFKYEGKCLDKEYHNDEYVFYGKWDVEKEGNIDVIHLEMDINKKQRWLFLLFPCYELIENMQDYTQLWFYIKTGVVEGGRCSASLKFVKIQ